MNAPRQHASASAETAPAEGPAPPGERLLALLAETSLDCIHCGLCLNTCPTYRLTGVEASSPRGRIALMRAAGEGRLDVGEGYREELDFCLLCRHCESACPAGVPYGRMMELARDQARAARIAERPGPAATLGRFAKRVGLRYVLTHRPLLRLAGALGRAAQVLGLTSLAARLLPGGRAAAAHLPAFPPLAAQRPLPEHLPARPVPGAAERGDLLLLEGCLMPLVLGDTNRAAAASLSALGWNVRVPRGVVCCGSLQAHNGELDTARELARTLIAAAEEAGEDLPFATHSAGCGSHLRELGHLFENGDPWRARAEAFSARVRDYSELVAGPLQELRPPAVEREAVAWDAPCHLCHGQRVRAEPHAVLDALVGLDLRPLEDEESCCGSAGLYSLLRPEDAAAVFAPRSQAFEASGARVLVTANPGCQLQWSAGLAGSGARVRHLAELVHESLEALRTAQAQAR